MTSLPRLVTWLVGRLLPLSRAHAVLDDLNDDYAAVLAGRGTAASRIWLVRETGSLVRAYIGASLRRFARGRPVLVRDLQQALRSIRRRPVGTVTAVAMLACGLASVALTVGLIDALLLQPVSPRHGAGLRRIAHVDRTGRVSAAFSHREMETLRAALTPAATVVAVNLQPVAIRAHGAPDFQTLGEVVTPSYTDLDSRGMLLGRALSTGDDDPGAPPVAVLGERLWRRRLGGDPGIVGRTLILNTTPVTIVGVSRARGSAAYFGASVDVWIPVAAGDAMLNPGWRSSADDRSWLAMAIATNGTEALERGLLAATATLQHTMSNAWRERRLLHEPGLLLRGAQRTPARGFIIVLSTLAALILGAAIANASGLVLARAAAEARQTAVHLALGAGRATLVRRRILEGGLLGLLAGLTSLALYAIARARMAEVALQPTLILRVDLPWSLRLVAAILGAGSVCGVILALAPAAWSWRIEMATALRRGTLRAGSAVVPTMRRFLVSAQVAFSLALVMAAALFVRSTAALGVADAGFDRSGLVALDFDIEPAHGTGAGASVLARQALDQVRGLSQISAAAMASRAPVDASTPLSQVRRPGDQQPFGQATYLAVTDGYFETTGLHLLRGREFSRDDADRHLAIVNATLAGRLFPGEDPLGRTIVLDGLERSFEIIGVARDAKYLSLTEPAGAHVYITTQPEFGLCLLARTRSDSRRALEVIQRTLYRVGPGVVGFFPRTIDDHLALELLPGRAAAAAASLLGGFALLLSASGLYGMVAWFVEVRRTEIGVRLALGAPRSSVVRLVVGQAIATAAPGMVAGLALGGALVAVTRSSIAGNHSLEPAVVAFGIAVVALVVLAASAAPCRTAVRVDPALCLRD